ncbi:NAD-dependent epimerase/dehydratase family protein, partial [Flavobacteriaceae bacterium]|nr:NAD-dependent epimerase/dehydratase family protein [Flavobacteriaceae bacterium]
MSKNVLITGGSGYFGEKVVEEFLKLGFKCSVLDINSFDSSLGSKVDFFQVDIRDKNKVIQCCRNIDIVIHCVAQVPLAKNKNLFKSVNYHGTENILESSIINGVNHFIYISSSAIFGIPESNPVTEESPPIPCEVYGQAKLDGENLVQSYNNKLNTTIIRPRTIIGPGRLGIFQILFEWIYQGRNIPVFDNGKNIYQFVHSYDLVRSIVLICQNNKYGVFNIGTEDYCSMYETLQSVIKYSKSKSKIKSLKSFWIKPIMNLTSFIGLSPLGKYHSKMYGKSLYFDLTKSKKELGWSSKYSNKEMMIESYNWYVLNRKNILDSKKNKSHHKSAVEQKIL